jgi:hypothetical protein
VGNDRGPVHLVLTSEGIDRRPLAVEVTQVTDLSVGQPARDGVRKPSPLLRRSGRSARIGLFSRPNEPTWRPLPAAPPLVSELRSDLARV